MRSRFLREFEKETGIEIRAVYDSEAVKTVGLVNRLLTERDNPQCDVFWNNEEFRTRQLAARDVFRQTNGWTHLGYRTRRIVINTNFITAATAPRTFSDATNGIWRGKVALAYPLFGTTATHFHALRQHWGDGGLGRMVPRAGGQQALSGGWQFGRRQKVSRGEAWWGFTDSDDIAGAQREGFPVAPLPITDETLFVPNTVGVIRNCPHPEAAERLYRIHFQPKGLRETGGIARAGRRHAGAGHGGDGAGKWIGSNCCETWTPSPKRRRKSFCANAAHWIAATPPRSGRALEDAFEDFGRLDVDAAGFLRAGTRRGRRRR